MEIAGWEERYRTGARASEDVEAAPTPLLIRIVQSLPEGRALDLACGAGRNALWLAKNRWNVTAVDGSPAAIATVTSRAAVEGFSIDAHVADLTTGEFAIPENTWNLVLICYYLQRNLFESAKGGVAPGGLLLAIVHITEDSEQPSPHRLRPGELEQFFGGWEVVHRYEGSPEDTAHRRAVAEIVARKPR